jgi:hypothetical protein
MATSSWNLRGASTNEFIVGQRILKDIHVQSEWKTTFGKLNGNRQVKITENERGSNVQFAAGGNDSPVWEQEFGTGVGEARFTYEEPMNGLRTFGQADVVAGDFPSFKHEVIYACQIDSEAVPLVDRESQMRQDEIIPVGTLMAHTKDKFVPWREKWVEVDAISALLRGASESLLSTSNGGMGITLPGCSAGAHRSCYNFVAAAAAPALVSPNFTNATHEAAVATAIATMSDVQTFSFDYAQHKFMSDCITELRFQPVRVGGKTYRAVCIADPRNIDRLLRSDASLFGSGELQNLIKYSSMGQGQDKNMVLDGMTTVELDDILYISNRYMKYFRPTQTASTSVAYGVAFGADPYASGFSNTSCICLNIYCGAGALLRGTRKKMWYTVSGEEASDAGHKKGTSVALHYYDAWKRKEFVTKDGTSAILNNSTVIWAGYDKGIGTTYGS